MAKSDLFKAFELVHAETAILNLFSGKKLDIGCWVHQLTDCLLNTLLLKEVLEIEVTFKSLWIKL